ncbi:Cobalamin biosynthesis protein CbiG [hydrothermal vent metagenome]|uniref:Cobalamin biosynthesis protein CbiG n=1 Tax=hydrothermal vent metagenome TaxID=652676 RepID=A0A1W1CXX4_9ZZZZ
MKIAIVTINQPSLNSACKLVPYLSEHEVDVYGKKDLTHNLKELKLYNKLDDILAPAWKSYDAIVCILAMGAVVRKIAPLLEDKSTDPAVIVINLALDKIVPLLSGHLGGANALADTIANSLPNCMNFISTATDQTKTLAFEMLAQKCGWKIENLKALARVSNRLLNKQMVKVATYASIFETIPNKENLELVDFENIDLDTVVIAPHIVSNSLTLRPKIYLGIGCNRDTPMEEIEEAVMLFLKSHNLTMEDVKNIGSFEAKADEVGLLEFAKKYNFDLEFYKKDAINALENEFSKSASTKFFGLKGVAEPSAVLLSENKELIINKEIYNKKITIAGAI